MIPLEYNDPDSRSPIRHPEDVEYLRSILHSHGYSAKDFAIQKAYSEWSEDYYCAGWIGISRNLSGDDEIDYQKRLFDGIMKYLRVIEKMLFD